MSTATAGSTGRLLDIQEAASTVRLRIAVRGLELLAERSASAVGAFAAGAPVAVRVGPGSGWLVDSAPVEHRDRPGGSRRAGIGRTRQIGPSA